MSKKGRHSVLEIDLLHLHPLGGAEERERERSGTENHRAECTQSYRWTEILMQAEAGKYANMLIQMCTNLYSNL